VESPETILLSLESPTGGATLDTTNAVLTIIDNEIPAGSLDTTFTAGANDTVYSVSVQRSDDRIAAGGNFTLVGGLARDNVARVDATGVVDGFDPGVILRNGTTNTTVRAVAVYNAGPHAGKIVAAGLFTTAGGVARSNIVRFNADGT